MAHQKVTPFFLAIVDKDRSMAALEGPMSDDTPWIDAVCRAQERGKAVRCYSVGGDRGSAIASFAQNQLKLVDSRVIFQG